MSQDLLADLGPLVERLDHVSMAVADIGEAARLMDTLGADFVGGGDDRPKQFRWVQFALPGGTIEMIQPLPAAPEDHFLTTFLARRGEGLHHITLKVGDLRSAIDVAAARGHLVVGIDDVRDSWKEAFVHPRSAHGVLVQLAQWDDTVTRGARSLEEALTGVSDGYET